MGGFLEAMRPTPAAVAPEEVTIDETREDQTMVSGSSEEWWLDRETRVRGGRVSGGSGGVRLSDVEHVAGRGQWSHKAEFILSCLGLSVGLGNVWRFPYLAYENGGAAFLVAYLVLQILVGKPMYLMELTLGQFSGKGPTRIWDMNPSAKGIGVAMCVIALNIAIYYNVIMAYALMFFYETMQSELPWTKCKPEWVREYNCVADRESKPSLCTADVTAMAQQGRCTCSGNATIDTALPFSCTPPFHNATSSAELFFYRSIIQLSEGLEPEHFGTPIWYLAICLFISWTIVVFTLLEGIKSSGKVVYFTATFPYFVLLVLLVRTSLLDGAGDGVYYFLVPDWNRLFTLKVWVAAAGQMFFSLGLTFGGVIVFGSYNKFRNEILTDAVLIASMDLVTSLIGGLVVFTTFGAMAKRIGTTIDKVARSGYGLAFVVYPEALAQIPPSHLWSLIFFFMLYTLGLDSQFAFMETIMTCLQDEFPKLRPYKTYIIIGMGIGCYLLGLPCICPGGDYVVTLMDHYGADLSLLFVAFCEVVAVMWVYGVSHFMMDIEYMTGHRPHFTPYWVISWTFFCPIIIGSLYFCRLIEKQVPKYSNGKPFPLFAQAIGYGISAVTVCPVILYFIYLLFKAYTAPSITNKEQRIHFLFEPDRHWKPNDGRSVPTSRPLSIT